MKGGGLRQGLLILPGVGWLLLFFVVPLAIIFVVSLGTRDQYGGVVLDRLSLDNYLRALEPDFLPTIANSLKYALATTVLSIGQKQMLEVLHEQHALARDLRFSGQRVVGRYESDLELLPHVPQVRLHPSEPRLHCCILFHADGLWNHLGEITARAYTAISPLMSRGSSRSRAARSF